MWHQPYVKWVKISFTGSFTKCWQEILHDVMLVKIKIPHALRCYSTYYCNTFIGNTFYCTFYCIPDIWCWLIYLNKIWLQKKLYTNCSRWKLDIYNPYTYVKLTEKEFALLVCKGFDVLMTLTLWMATTSKLVSFCRRNIITSTINDEM